MNWLDLLLVWMIGWSTWQGLKTGLVSGLARLCGLILGLFLAREFQAPLATCLKRQWPLEQWLKSWLAAPANGPATRPVSGLEQYLFQRLVQNLLDLISFSAILLITALLVGWVGELVGRVARLGFLGPVDRAGGLVLGVARGLVAAAILIALILSLKHGANLWLPGEPLPWLARALESSRLVRVLQPVVKSVQHLVPALVA
ncbi:MAG: CvpA family protein [Desulfofundulus sp.]|uniref:CvpA family protein n=1 Tax=Desulfofundulus sp. TaxID=2282750 RepID=UPI003C76E93D